MGYYTRHTLDVIEGDKELIKAFRKENENAKYAIDDEGYCEEHCKWYGSDDELAEFSKKHPDALFCLTGEGEEGDVPLPAGNKIAHWKAYVKAGEKQVCRAKIVFPEFDKGALLAKVRNNRIEKVVK